MNHPATSISTSYRYDILDILRGVALLGICLANFGELSLYTFQGPQVTSAMASADIDRIIGFVRYFLIDGKFYTLFSLLFGIGFSIILTNCKAKGKSGIRVFYRRMAVLAIIGLMHLVLLWAGDILLLYAILGMLLPLFRKTPDRRLLLFAGILLFLPVAVDTFSVLTGARFSPMALINEAVAHFHAKSGITPDNFGMWLREGTGYTDVLKFNLAGSFIRCGEFIEGNRIFKVLGLFLLGLYAGRKRLFADLKNNTRLLSRVRNWGFAVGIPLSLLYAWNAVSHDPLGSVGGSAVYAFSVVPMGLAYAAALCLWYARSKDKRRFEPWAMTGRMALTNYIGQSVAGMALFYGIGMALGGTMGLVCVEAAALGVFAFQMLSSNIWLRYFRFGPLEWVWRMLTYGKTLDLMKR